MARLITSAPIALLYYGFVSERRGILKYEIIYSLIIIAAEVVRSFCPLLDSRLLCYLPYLDLMAMLVQRVSYVKYVNTTVCFYFCWC